MTGACRAKWSVCADIILQMLQNSLPVWHVSAQLNGQGHVRPIGCVEHHIQEDTRLLLEEKHGHALWL
jgi:hypothetical protein